MTSLLDFPPRADAGGDDPLALLRKEIERWLGEQPRRLAEAPQFDHFLALAEGFDDLARRVRWVQGHIGPPTPPDAAFEATVALLAIALAAGQAAPHAFGSPRVPQPVGRAFLDLWTSGEARRAKAPAPHLAAVYLWGVWSPPTRPPLAMRWEPAGLLLQAMACKITGHGLHALAGRGVPPLATERRDHRAEFNERVVRAAHAALALLVTGECGKAFAAWDCELVTLWAFLADAILGPGRPDARAGGRPQPGAFKKSCLGHWAEQELGVIVGRREVYVCAGCEREHGSPTCDLAGDASVLATARDHVFVTPRDRLNGIDRELGCVQVKRRVCKNRECVERLRAVLARSGRLSCSEAQPLFDLDLDACPYCRRAGTAGQRPMTVWTRFP